MSKAKLKQALQLAGSQHKYQKFLLGLLAIAWIAMMFVFLSSPFLYMEPLFHCSDKGDDIVKETDACMDIEKCKPTVDFTMTTQIGLYCDLEWARTFIQSCFPIGSFTGLMVVNLISDTKGRKEAFLMALSITISGLGLLLIGAYSQNPYLLMISQFLRGFGSQSIYPLCYTLCADFLSERIRPKAIVFLNSSGGIVSIVLGFFYILEMNWLYFVIFFQILPFIIVLIVFHFFLQESPFILMNKNFKWQAKQVYHRIAKFNGRQENIEKIDQIIDEYRNQEQNKLSAQNVIRTVRQWKYLKTIIILIVVNGIAHMNYLGIAYSFAEVGLGYGYNSMMLGLVQTASILFVRWIVTNVPRKKGISGFYALTMLVGLLYFIPFIEQNKYASTLMVGISRIFSVSANCLIGCLQTEAFTTEIQSSAIGLIEGLGLWGAVAAPFIVQGAQHIGLYPMGAIALFVSFGIWPPFFLKETFKPAVKKGEEGQIEQKLVESSEQAKQGEERKETEASKEESA